MRVYDNSVNTLQQQTFTFERLVQYRNGDPYVVTVDLHDPYIVFSLGSSKYTKNEKTFKQWWDKIDDAYPRFKQAKVEETSTILVDPSEYFPSGWTRSNSDTVFKYTGTDTETIKKGDYFYYKKVVEDETTTYSTEPYEFRYIRVFTYDEVKDLQNLAYEYDIKVVAGVNNYLYLTELLHYYNVDTQSYEVEIAGNKFIFEVDSNYDWYYYPTDSTLENSGTIPNFGVLREFAKSDPVKQFIFQQGEQELKDYKEQLKPCNSNHPITTIDYTEYLLTPSAFNVGAVVKGVTAYERN